MHISNKECVCDDLFFDHDIRTNTMRLHRLFLKSILLIGIVAWLTACGGSGSDSETSTDCVLGTSTIGDCEI